MYFRQAVRHSSGMSQAANARSPSEVRQRGNSLPVRVFMGVDPVTGKDSYVSETVRVPTMRHTAKPRRS